MIDDNSYSPTKLGLHPFLSSRLAPHCQRCANLINGQGPRGIGTERVVGLANLIAQPGLYGAVESNEGKQAVSDYFAFRGVPTCYSL